MHIKGCTKFKIGDLVCLSAYGEARQYNVGWHGHYGIIVETQNPFNHHYPYKVHFLSKTGNRNVCRDVWQVFHPRELKHMKPNKSDS